MAHYFAKEYEKIFDYYPYILEEFVTLKVSTMNLIADDKGQQYIIQEEDEIIPMAKDFTVIKENNQYYALEGN